MNIELMLVLMLSERVREVGRKLNKELSQERKRGYWSKLEVRIQTRQEYPMLVMLSK